MTKEQTEACEKLGQHHLGSWEKDNDYPVFKEGFQAAQTPEMLLLNPIVKGLVEALKPFSKNQPYPEKNDWAYVEIALAPLTKEEK